MLVLDRTFLVRPQAAAMPITVQGGVLQRDDPTIGLCRRFSVLAPRLESLESLGRDNPQSAADFLQARDVCQLVALCPSDGKVEDSEYSEGGCGGLSKPIPPGWGCVPIRGGNGLLAISKESPFFPRHSPRGTAPIPGMRTGGKRRRVWRNGASS
jgi:hypothetical protein